MSLLFMESFDHYTSDAETLRKWSAMGASPSSVTVSGSAGRNGTAGLALVATSTASISKVFTGAATIIVGFAYQPSAVSAERQICAFYNSGTLHVDINHTGAGAIKATRNGTSLGQSADNVIVASSYHYIEIKVTIDDAAGVVVVKVDGTTVLNLSGVDTRNGASALCDTFLLGGSRQSCNTANHDDLYILNTSGSAPLNDFLGDVRVECLFPSGAGNYAQLTPSTGSNYQCVDEATPNDDTDYISSATATHKDSYAYGNLSSSGGTVYAVGVNLHARKDDAGTRTIKSLVRLSATDANGSDQNVTTSYINYQQIHTAIPGGGAWSVANVNNAEFGVEIVA